MEVWMLCVVYLHRFFHNNNENSLSKGCERHGGRFPVWSGCYEPKYKNQNGCECNLHSIDYLSKGNIMWLLVVCVQLRLCVGGLVSYLRLPWQLVADFVGSNTPWPASDRIPQDSSCFQQRAECQLRFLGTPFGCRLQSLRLPLGCRLDITCASVSIDWKVVFWEQIWPQIWPTWWPQKILPDW